MLPGAVQIVILIFFSLLQCLKEGSSRGSITPTSKGQKADFIYEADLCKAMAAAAAAHAAHAAAAAVLATAAAASAPNATAATAAAASAPNATAAIAAAASAPNATAAAASALNATAATAVAALVAAACDSGSNDSESRKGGIGRGRSELPVICK